ncbi:hypothetical protein FQA39_LY15319 [Lamprigera yunnana]|nr:hypothetical protein FQA39_LY15319 [Lamprigera yunnana]
MSDSVFLQITTSASSWKLCEQTFCGKLRKSPEGYDVKYQVVDNGTIDNEVVFSTMLKSEKPDAPILKLFIRLYENEIFHFYIDEVQNNTKKKRFRASQALQDKELLNSTLSIKVVDKNITLTSGKFTILIQKDTFLIHLYDNNRLTSVINAMNSFVFSKGGSEIAMEVTLKDVQRAYGIPEHADHLALQTTKKDEPYRHFNLDYGNYRIESREALYGAVNVLYGHGNDHSSGVFWLNAAQTWIDLEISPNKVDAFFMSESGVLEMFILTGPTLPRTVMQYTKLTGTAPLPQYFTLGYHQSRYSYMTQQEVLDVVLNLDISDMPVDAMWLDIDYTEEKKYFTWDKVRFPNPQDLIDTLKETNRKLVAIIDPHIKVDDEYMVHQTAKESNYYINNSDGTPFQGECWPGLSSYLDFLNPDALNYYSGLYSDHYFQNENVHLWNDMNEPAVFNAPEDENTMPLNAIHYGAWEHRDVHNMYGFHQVVGTRNGLLKRQPHLRPFILTRSHFAGTQRYAAIWTGDNAATWDYLKISFPMCLTEALAGISFCGADIGGFSSIPEDELYQRWYQAGAWLPFYRAHSAIDVPRREPYLYNRQIQERIRKALYQRYAHMPVWYTQFYQHEKTGEPVIRPITYHYPQESDAFSIENQILLGPNILAAPVLEKGILQKPIYLPGGKHEMWINIDDNYSSYQGIGYQLINVTLDSVPVFYRAGSIIPRKDSKQKSSVDTYTEPFTLYICLNETDGAEGPLYVDDYETFNYTKKEFKYVNLKFINKTLSIDPIDETTYNVPAPIKKIIIINAQLNLISATFCENNVTTKLNITVEMAKGVFSVENFTAYLHTSFRIDFEFADLASSSIIHYSSSLLIILIVSVTVLF